MMIVFNGIDLIVLAIMAVLLAICGFIIVKERWGLSTTNKSKNVVIKQQTNADRIKAMTDEELAEFLCLPQKVCPVDNCEECFEDSCQKCIYEWLRKEAESGESG